MSTFLRLNRMVQVATDKQSRLKRLFNKYFDFKTWGDWKRTKSMTDFFVNAFKRLFVPRKLNPEDAQKFDELVEKMALSDEDLKNRLTNFRRLYILMIVAAFFFYAYAMYQLLYGGLLSVILALVVMFVCVALAFRYHFWHFQIKHRRLGCSLTEWFKTSFMGGDK